MTGTISRNRFKPSLRWWIFLVVIIGVAFAVRAIGARFTYEGEDAIEKLNFSIETGKKVYEPDEPIILILKVRNPNLFNVKLKYEPLDHPFTRIYLSCPGRDKPEYIPGGPT